MSLIFRIAASGSDRLCTESLRSKAQSFRASATSSACLVPFGGQAAWLQVSLGIGKQVRQRSQRARRQNIGQQRRHLINPLRPDSDRHGKRLRGLSQECRFAQIGFRQASRACPAHAQQPRSPRLAPEAATRAQIDPMGARWGDPENLGGIQIDATNRQLRKGGFADKIDRWRPAFDQAL